MFDKATRAAIARAYEVDQGDGGGGAHLHL
jgi:hypothetical protein